MSRTATSDDAVRGRMPGVVHEPATVEEASEVLAMLARDGHASFFVGGGTKLGLGAAPARLDAVVRTTKLARVVEYAPSDQVVSVEAGITLAALQTRLAADGQRLSLDAPWNTTSTIGGIIATNAFGPLRARSGSIRDLMLGISLVRADGVLARGGGKVVKNVAGFDLPKLLCGSLGTLGLIARATLRVHPLPEATEVRVVRALPSHGVVTLLKTVSTAQLEPASLLAVKAKDGAWDVALRFEGFGAGVTQQVARLGTLAAAEPADGALFDAHQAAREQASLRIKIAALPTALPEVERAMEPLLALLPGTELAWYPSLGLGFLSANANANATAHADAIGNALRDARRQLAARHGQLTIETAPESLRASVPAWDAPSALRLHQAMKARFDPDGLLAPGTFVGGI